MRYVAIAGTHGTDGSAGADDARQWWHRDSAWRRYMATQGWEPARPDDPFTWSGDVDGDLPWPWSLGRRHSDWDAGAASLVWYLRLIGRVDDVVLVAHSHGGQVALGALAHPGCPRVHALCTVCTPVRQDMDRAALLARTAVDYWLHISNPGAWDNKWQAAGSLFDGGWGWQWAQPRASRTDLVRGMGIGHTGVLEDPKHFGLWASRGWLAELAGSPMTAGTAPVAPGATGVGGSAEVSR